jgi:hypothetical protein
VLVAMMTLVGLYRLYRIDCCSFERIRYISGPFFEEEEEEEEKGKKEEEEEWKEEKKIILPYFSIDNAHPKPFRNSF